MDTVLDRPWTAERFLAWEDQQEGKHEFGGLRVIPMTGCSFAHQWIVTNLCVTLRRLLLGKGLLPISEMRLRIGQRFRYPDVQVCRGPIDQTIKTLTDAVAIFEIASDDTAATERVIKLREYAEVPSLRCYVLLEQTAVAATLFQRNPGGQWIATAHIEGALPLPGLDIAVPLEDLYQGLTFAAPE
ncbi:MAG: Uma2 family endonuclease [Acetobacteraceae bacterium]